MKRFKPIRFCLFAILATAFLQGCATIEITPRGAMDGMTVDGYDGKDLRHVYVSNGGYYLFSWWPLAMGDIRWDEKKQDIRGGTTLFREQGTLQDVEELLAKIAERENCDLVGVVALDDERMNNTIIVNYVETIYCGLLVSRNGGSAETK